jgi:hypothetical protein
VLQQCAALPHRLWNCTQGCTHVYERITIQRTCIAHDARPHTYNRERDHIHPCIRECRHTKYKHACMPCTYLHSSAQRNSIYTMHNRAHFNALIRAGYVLHSLECLERAVVGKCCSNVLGSLRACGVVLKAVRTCVYENSDTAHARSSRCAISYVQPESKVIYTHAYVYADIPMRTRVHALHVYLPTFIPVYNATVYSMHKRAPLLRTHLSRPCTALTGVFGALSCGQVLQQCAALPPRLWSCSQGCTHMCM